MENTKLCSRCHKELPFSSFYKDKTNKRYGLMGYCKDCLHSYQKERKFGKPISHSKKEAIEVPSTNIMSQDRFREIVLDQIMLHVRKE